MTFSQFPRGHWKHLRTSNPVESSFAAVRLRTAAAKRFKKVENATAVIWKTLLIAEQTFRRLDAPELLADVASVGKVLVNADGFTLYYLKTDAHSSVTCTGNCATTWPPAWWRKRSSQAGLSGSCCTARTSAIGARICSGS